MTKVDYPDCQVCKKEKRTSVACVPGVPYSAAYCEECFNANAHPYNLVVDNTWAAGGYEDCAEWWQELVMDTLEHLSISFEQFTHDIKMR